MSELASFEVLSAGPVIRASLAGELDLSNVAQLERAIVDAVPNDAAGMVLDVSGITYIDSAGLRMLLTLVGRFRWRGQELVLFAPGGSRLRRVIQLAGAEEALAVDEDASAALARVHAVEDA